MKTKAVEFDGLEATKIYNDRLEMVVVSSLGPRIAFLGFRRRIQPIVLEKR